MNTIYTFGYSGQAPEDLRQKAAEYGALVVDTRHKPQSWQRAWNMDKLTPFFGRDYIWAPELGNVAFEKGRIEIADLPAAARRLRLTLEERPIILLCGCPDVTRCHRRVAAEYLAETLGAEVEHIPQPTMIWTISLHQPYASLIGAKRIETRGKPPLHAVVGQRIAIHAAKIWGPGQRSNAEFAPIAAALRELGYEPTDLPRGKILCTAVLDHWEWIKANNVPPEPERSFGNYTLHEGRCAWYLQDIHRLLQPVAADGQRGWWKFPLDKLGAMEPITTEQQTTV